MSAVAAVQVRCSVNKISEVVTSLMLIFSRLHYTYQTHLYSVDNNQFLAKQSRLDSACIDRLSPSGLSMSQSATTAGNCSGLLMSDRKNWSLRPYRRQHGMGQGSL
jgi:hypothetical protein